ncbi:MAG: AAA family ATPase, partial [Planctomycetaceae bacterium]|nr:AAA family ATPase [Planctomycetaceae bacterium]
MSIAETIKKILGFVPPETGILNSAATHSPVAEKLAEPSRDELSEFEITEDYQKTLELIDAEVPIIFVTGRAGTGKSTFIRFIRKKYQGQVAIVAPTGVAAMNAGGATIHSFFMLPPRVVEPADIKKVDNNRLYKALRILVVDEVSMVRADMLDAMDQFLRLNGKRPELPFGGVQVVLVGDLAQLPPVVGKKEESILFTRRYKSPFFFSSEVLSKCFTAPVELSRVFRQTDSSFIDILSKIRLGKVTDADLAWINQRTNQQLPDPTPVVLTPTNASADEINREGLARIEGEAQKYKGCIVGDFKVEEDRLPSPLILELKIDARVMFTRNDSEKRWVNGTLGRVVEMTSGHISVELDEGGRGIVDVTPSTWESYRYRYDEVAERVVAVVVGSFTQFPLQLAW